MELGRLGVWAGGPWLERARGAEAARAAAALEQLGYAAIWRSGGFEPSLSAAFAGLLAATRRLVVASGIVSIWHTAPAAAAAGAAALEQAHPGRFLLGLGVSHAHLVERTGQRYEHPCRRMGAYLDALDRDPRPVPSDRRVLAALGPRMLRLAGRRALGAHPYFVPVEHTRRARVVLGPGPLLAPEQAAVLETDPALARQIARTHASVYLAAPNYVRNLRRLGVDAADLASGGSDALVDRLVAWGSAEAVAARVRAHLDAGADHVCVQLLGRDPRAFPLDGYRRLAAALADVASRPGWTPRGG